MEFLDFLFFAILAFYIIRSIARVVLPIVFQNIVNKSNASAGAPTNGRQPRYNSNVKSDKIKVDYIPKSNKNTVPDSEGEFVDYEEVK
jgi:hypothetical protein